MTEFTREPSMMVEPATIEKKNILQCISESQENNCRSMEELMRNNEEMMNTVRELTEDMNLIKKMNEQTQTQLCELFRIMQAPATVPKKVVASKPISFKK